MITGAHRRARSLARSHAANWSVMSVAEEAGRHSCGGTTWSRADTAEAAQRPRSPHPLWKKKKKESVLLS